MAPTPEPVLNGYVDGARVRLVRRDAAGRRRLHEVPAEWVMYLRADDTPAEVARMVRSSHHVASCRQEGAWLRVGWKADDVRRWATRDERSDLVARQVRSFEADVDPVRRWMTDTGTGVTRPRRVYLDLETDSRVPFSRKEEMRVLSWVLVDSDGNPQIGVLPADSDSAEQELLHMLWEQLAPYDQVLAWNGDGFDFPVLGARTAQSGLRIDHRPWLWLDHMALWKRLNMHAAESGEEKTSMALQSVATAVLGHGKDDFDARHTYEAWAAGGAERARMVRYMIKDGTLLHELEGKSGYVELFNALCEACHLFPDTPSLQPIRQMDGFLLRQGAERGHRFPTRRRISEEDAPKFKGAYVMQPKVLDADWRKKRGMADGIAREVHVADFGSMYPTIILSWNMSPDTKVDTAPVNGPIPPGMCRVPGTGVCFRTDAPGILPTSIADLMRLRKHWNDLKASLPPGTPEWYDADRRSSGYKVAVLTFYGGVGSPFSRYYDVAVAESVTRAGVWLIQATAAEAEKRGWVVIYADTDSIFVLGCTREQFAEFVQWCNAELYPELLRKQGCVGDTRIKLAYEKAFERIVFTAAKRYAGRYSHYKGKPAAADSKPEIKGLEFMRGDTALLARQLQRAAIELLMAGADQPEAFTELLTGARDHVLKDALPVAEVQLAKAVTKSLKEYAVRVKDDGTKGDDLAHVRVAKILAERGRPVGEGTRIEYVVVDGADSPQKVIPAEDYAGECDRYYVWESLVWPPTERLLAAAMPAHDWVSWGRVRPPKPRAPRKGAGGEGQGGLFEAPAGVLNPGFTSPAHPAVPATPAAPRGGPQAAPQPPPDTQAAPPTIARPRAAQARLSFGADATPADVRVAAERLAAQRPGVPVEVRVELPDGSVAILDGRVPA